MQYFFSTLRQLKENERSAITESATTGKCIICYTNKQRNQLIKKANKMGLNIPTPINLVVDAKFYIDLGEECEFEVIDPFTAKTLYVKSNASGFYLTQVFQKDYELIPKSNFWV